MNVDCPVHFWLERLRDECEGDDLILVSGPIHEKLKEARQRPRFVILNHTPLDPENIEGMRAAGYEVLDQWENEENSGAIFMLEQQQIKGWNCEHFALN